MANAPGLTTYINQVREAQKAGTITPTEARYLIEDARIMAQDGKLDSTEKDFLRTELSTLSSPGKGQTPGTGTGPGTGPGTGETDEQRRAREEEERRRREEEQRRENSRPGGAWVWDGTRWTRPSRPTDGKPYTWDDNLGWQVDEALIKSRANASEYLSSLFKQFGFSDADITSLMGQVDGWIQQGLADAGTEPVLMKFRDTDIYKRRFAGMAELIGRGQAISEAEYIQLESSYRNVMQNYGLPGTYYDNYDDYARLIGAGLSVREVEERVVAAKQAMNPLVAQELSEYYDITDGDLTAYMLGLTDEKGLQLASARNQEQIRTRGRAAQIGAAAERAGFSMDREFSERLGGTSVGQNIDPFQLGTLSQLESEFARSRRIADRETTLAGIDRETYDQRDALSAAFGDDKARLASERRAKRERARFSGSSGVASSSIGVERNL
jgi:hypothetical protein